MTMNEDRPSGGCTDPSPPEADREALATLDNKLLLVDDRITAVVRGYATGLYLCGAGGLGKSYTVYQKLQELEVDFRTFNSRMTALGLYRALEGAPDSIHILEDMERITGDRDAQGVLRSALWSQGDRERWVTWVTGAGERRFAFRGGIIMLANRPLADLPELRALAGRIAVLTLQITDAEMAAHMRRIAALGWSRYQHSLDAAKCLEVCACLIAECRRANCPLDLRLLDNSALDYLQWERADSHLHWHDLVANRVRQAATHFRHDVSLQTREGRKAYERELVRQILQETSDPQQRERRWREATGKGKSAFYERRREVESREFDV
jgi:hypothetical protein